jgi:hypothetical protein
MTSSPHSRPRSPKLSIDLPTIVARFHAVIHASTPKEEHAALVEAVYDVPLLLAEVSRLWSLLLTTRARCADLEAAARAALSAQRDGEPDPLAYLADELAGEWPAAAPSTQDSR